MSRVEGALVSGERADHYDEASADFPGGGVWVSPGTQVFDELLHDFKADFLVEFFPAFETECYFDFHIFAKEVDGVALFDMEVMGIDVDA